MLGLSPNAIPVTGITYSHGERVPSVDQLWAFRRPYDSRVTC
jgi:hypothetical protein